MALVKLKQFVTVVFMISLMKNNFIIIIDAIKPALKWCIMIIIWLVKIANWDALVAKTYQLIVLVVLMDILLYYLFVSQFVHPKHILAMETVYNVMWIVMNALKMRKIVYLALLICICITKYV